MRKLYVFLFTLLYLNFGFGQSKTIVWIDRDNQPTPTATFTGPNMMAEGFVRGPGISQAGADAEDRFRTKNWNATSQAEAETNQEYIEWSVTGEANFNVNITELRIHLKRNTDGPKNFRILYSLDGFTTSIPVTTDQNLATNAAEIFSFSGLNIDTGFGGTVIFRLHAWNASDTEEGRLNVMNKQSWGVPSLPQPGSILKGTVNFDGIRFVAGVWKPNAPSASTGSQNALLESGTYTIGSDIELKDLKIESSARLNIESTGNLKLNGNLVNLGQMTMTSTSLRYPSLIIDGTSFGKVTYSRHVNTNYGARGNDLVSAPVTGERFNVFIQNNPNVFSNRDNTLKFFGPFDKIIGDFVTYATNEPAQLDAATGYRTASIDNGNYTFNGEVNTGTIVKNILYRGPAYQEWNLIGNPFPSYIDPEPFLMDNLSQFDPLRAAIYGYDGDTSDGWQVWNFAHLTTHEDVLITPGQGFFVATNPGGGTISFHQRIRTTGINDDFIPGRNTLPKNVGYAQLKLSNGKDQYKTNIYFNERSTKALDIGYDAGVYGNKAPSFSIYSHLVEGNEGLDMAVQSLPYDDLTNAVIIPLGINVPKGQQVIVSMHDAIIPEEIELYLEDNVNNTFTLLNTAEYSFTADTNLKGTGRFFLHTANKTLSNSSKDFDGVQIYATMATKSLYIQGLMKDHTNLELYDIQGRMVMNGSLQVNSNSSKWDLGHLQSGVYLVKLKSKSQEKTQKIIVN